MHGCRPGRYLALHAMVLGLVHFQITVANRLCSSCIASVYRIRRGSLFCGLYDVILALCFDILIVSTLAMYSGARSLYTEVCCAIKCFLMVTIIHWDPVSQVVSTIYIQ